jgi:hypothetical protein
MFKCHFFDLRQGAKAWGMRQAFASNEKAGMKPAFAVYR